MGSWMFKLLLLLQLVILLFKHADSSSIVRYLPGFQGPLPFELETGYVGVGEEEEEQMFYYFIKSESNPQEDPLLLWLSGGPGCSSLVGLLFESGPMTLKVETYNGDIPSLVSTTHSWTKVASIIYLDQPVGTGFSYSRNPLGHLSNDSRSAKRVDEFVRNWLDKHPDFSSNPFYVAGTSYAGMVIPAIVQEISNGNCLCCTTPINLQGYVLGNPITEFENNYNSRIQFAHGMGLISDELYESLRISCRGKYWKVSPFNTECSKLVQDFEKSVSGLYEYYILAPKKKETSLEPNVNQLCKHWANAERVQGALQVDEGSIGEWIQCHWEIPYTIDMETSSVPYHMNNSLEGYRSLIFSGDHDMVVPFISTRNWIKSLNYSIVDDWRPWMINDHVAGYTRTYANHMTFAAIKGGGHTPEYSPDECSVMFKRWITGQPL